MVRYRCPGFSGLPTGRGRVFLFVATSLVGLEWGGTDSHTDARPVCRSTCPCTCFQTRSKSEKTCVTHCFFIEFVSKIAQIFSFYRHPATVSDAPLPIRDETVERYCPTVQPLMLLAARDELDTRLLSGVLLVAVAIFDPADVPNI